MIGSPGVVNAPTAERACETCGVCCKVFEITPLRKSAHILCHHYVADSGCGIHGKHPKVCKVFRCNWLEDQSLGDEWRPDRCGFVVHRAAGGLGLWINVDLDRPGAWRQEPFYGQIKIWSRMIRYGTGIVAVSEGGRRWVIFPEQDLPVSPGSTGAGISAGYHARPGWRQPFATIKQRGGSTEEFVGVPFPELH